MSKKRKSSVPGERVLVSLATLAEMMDAHRSTVRRWLNEAGIRPVALGCGKNGAIRYRWHEVEEFVGQLERVK